MNVPWRPNGWQYRCVWSILYTGTGYAAVLIYFTAGGWDKARISLNSWLTMTLINMQWGHLMFTVRRLELCMANRHNRGHDGHCGQNVDKF